MDPQRAFCPGEGVGWRSGWQACLRSADGLYAEYKEPLYAAPPLLQRMVDAGRLGRKTGSGFYPYG
ncbi:3-hydroxyacyl-CoA dehydrogenase family protein [Streptomyces sp. NPDC058637]|uniref:3-hydroxyacyl-CoA dehydrogenase family protein n=1 Tax=Streptomyces sp. NPDC058637 TaxID=3346569 RepID=UPI0036585D17